MLEPHPSSSDENLARQTQAGSLSAFEELVSRYEHRLYSFVANCISNAADAREITQDTFVRAFEAIAQFDPRHPFASWLFTIARHKCIDRHRSAPPISDEPAPEFPDLNDPSELLARREDSQRLWLLARHKLPSLQFQALWLKYAEEMPVAEIARVLGKTKTHIKVLLFRARQALGRELEQQVLADVANPAPRPAAPSTEAPSRFTLHVSRP